MVLGLEALGREVARGADGLQDGEVVLAADRHVLVDDVAELEQQGLCLSGRLVLLGVGGLHGAGQFGGLPQQVGLLVAGGLGDALAERLLFGAQLVESGAGRPAPLVGGEKRVDEADVLSTGTLRRAHTVGVLTEQTKVNHGDRLPGAAPRCDKLGALCGDLYLLKKRVEGKPLLVEKMHCQPNSSHPSNGSSRLWETGVDGLAGGAGTPVGGWLRAGYPQVAWGFSAGFPQGVRRNCGRRSRRFRVADVRRMIPPSNAVNTHFGVRIANSIELVDGIGVTNSPLRYCGMNWGFWPVSPTGSRSSGAAMSTCPQVARRACG